MAQPRTPDSGSADRWIAEGVRLHQAGRREEAEARYRAALASSPGHPDALVMLGVLHSERGDHAGAIELFGHALAARPGDALALFNLGLALRHAGRLHEALDAFQHVIAVEPGNTRALVQAASLHAGFARHREALACLEQAIRSGDQRGTTLVQFAEALMALSRGEEALAVLESAARQHPGSATVAFARGRCLHRLGRLAQAQDAYRAVLSVEPAHAGALNNLGLALRDSGHPAEAVPHFERALGIDPDSVDVLNNLGMALSDLGRPHEAALHLQRAAGLAPDHVPVLSNLGAALMERRDARGAVTVLDRALDLAGGSPDVAFNLSLACLLAGDFERGWHLYEARHHRDRSERIAPPEGLPGRMWQGEPLQGRRILMVGEQGLGDQIQFVRYARDLADRGARVDVLVGRELERLARSVPGVDAAWSTLDEAPAHDYWVFMMSVPRWLGFDVATIGRHVPYVRAGADRVEHWRDRLGPRRGLRVGLVWAGSPRTGVHNASLVDRRRSIPLQALGPLLDVPGVEWFSLQKGPGAVQLGDLPDVPIRDLMDEVRDFADTAALVANLDLVITVDTSMAHLAGAVGMPVWVLSRADGCWRWLLDRSDSPWYPHLRLFRQQAAHEWGPVVADVARALATLAAARGSARDVTAGG